MISLIWGRHLVVTGLFLFLCGCDADYYLHLLQGQAKVVMDSQSIEDLLSSSLIDDKTRRKLTFIDSIRTFAQDNLGLEVDSNYTCFFDTEGQPISWNVSACPPHHFTPYKWTFPIVGSLPYKGYFDKSKAQDERDSLRARGYDTIMRPVSAYSTLGFLSDPVLSPMLQYSEERLVDLMLHELTHATIYIANHADFNESLATFIGKEGTLAFIALRYGADAPIIAHIKQERQDIARFRTFLISVTASLDSLYKQDLPKNEILERREHVFREAQDRYKFLRSQFTATNFDYFLEWKINNAQLMSYRRYNRDLELFSRVYESNGQRLDQLVSLCKSCSDSANPWQCLRGKIAK